MAFVTRINPFGGILCVPYWNIWIIIIISWIIILIRISCIKWIHKYQLNTLKTDLKTVISHRLRQETRSHLQGIQIENEPLPSEIITVIMDMLPIIDESWEIYAEAEKYKNERKRRILKNTLYIYPIIRFLANFLNFIIIMVQYGKWHSSNSETSTWDKYCAFILAWFYMPNWKGTDSNSLWIWQWADMNDMESSNKKLYELLENFVSIQIPIIMLFAVWFSLLSLPIFVAGIFVYIPSTILIGIIGMVIFVVIYLMLQKLILSRGDSKYSDFAIMTGILSYTSFCGMWFFILIVVCTMEYFSDALYSGENWVRAYGIGFLGEYCDESDYFEFGKWNEYEWHIRFLIVSWFIF